jgi:hypothetical protein
LADPLPRTHGKRPPPPPPQVYTFIGLVEALLLSMIISPVSNFGSFMATAGMSEMQQVAAFLAVYAIALAMGIAFLNLIIIIVLYSYLSGVHPDHLEEEVRALPVFGVPAVALVCSVICFLLWFLCFTFVTVNWVMPVIVLVVCVAAGIVFLPVLVYLFVFRLPYLSRKKNAQRKKALAIPVSIPYNVYDRVVEELVEERAGAATEQEERLRRKYRDMLFQPRIISRERQEQIVLAEQTMTLPVKPDHGDLAPMFLQEFSEREKLCAWGGGRGCAHFFAASFFSLSLSPFFFCLPPSFPPAQTGGCSPCTSTP